MNGIEFTCRECNRTFILDKEEYNKSINNTYITCPYNGDHKILRVTGNIKYKHQVSELGKKVGIKSTRKQNRYGL